MTQLCLSFLLKTLICLCAAGSALSLTVVEACADFDPDPDGPPVSWGLLECMEVWGKWGGTIKDELHISYPDPEVLGELSDVLRRRGSPCIVRGDRTLDGTGSSLVRHLAGWLYSKEVGCDWIAPDFNQGDVAALFNPESLDGADTLYCHRTEYVFKFNASKPLSEGTEARRCSTVSWLHYFHLTQHSILPPTTGVIKTVEVRRM